MPRSRHRISPYSLPWMSSRSSTKAIRTFCRPASNIASTTDAMSGASTVDSRSSSTSSRDWHPARHSSANMRHMATDTSRESVPSNT